MQVHVQQQYALAGLAEDRRKIGGDERLAGTGGGAGDHHAVVAGIQHRELQRHAEAAQALDGNIVRIGLGQYADQQALASCCHPGIQAIGLDSVGLNFDFPQSSFSEHNIFFQGMVFFRSPRIRPALFQHLADEGPEYREK